MRIRDLQGSDLDAVLALNQAHEQELSPLDQDGLRGLLDMALAAWVAEVDGAVGGFAVAFAPGSAYESRNYRWFGERYEDFVYLDRVAVEPALRRRGVGGRLYDALEDLAGSRGALVACEVNLVPRNDASLAFHAHRGFSEVGELAHDDGKVVRLLTRPTR